MHGNNDTSTTQLYSINMCLQTAKVERAQRQCQRCDGITIDGVEHMMFYHVALYVNRQKSLSMFACQQHA